MDVSSWMATGWPGVLEAGALALVAGALFHLGFARLFRDRPGHAEGLAWAFLAAVLLTGGRDLWNLFYLNYAHLESVTLLRVKLAGVHDPANLGRRALAEFVGAAIGVYLAWLPRRHR